MDRPRAIPQWRFALAHVHEELYGPLPDPDIVATQGRCLLPCPDTPLNLTSDTRSTITLEEALELAAFDQRQRVYKYGKAAEEWPALHTPSHIRQKWLDEQRAAIAEFHASSDDESIYSPDSTIEDPVSLQTPTPPSSSGSHDLNPKRTAHSKLALTRYASTRQSPTRSRNLKTAQRALHLEPARGLQKKRRREESDEDVVKPVVKVARHESFPQQSTHLRRVNAARIVKGNNAVGQVYDRTHPRRSARLNAAVNSVSSASPHAALDKWREPPIIRQRQTRHSRALR